MTAIGAHLLGVCRIVYGLIISYSDEPRETERYTPLLHLKGHERPLIHESCQDALLTKPCAAVYTGLKLKSAVRTSQTTLGSNQMSGLAPPTLISPRGLVTSNGLRRS